MPRQLAYKILFFLSLLLVATRLPSCAPGYVDELKIAVVIGNGTYETSPLHNAVNDAGDMAATLDSLGFEVHKVLNASKREMLEAFEIFSNIPPGRDVLGLFYYAGHGMQIDGSNYLVPIDANIKIKKDIEFEGVNIGRLIGYMEDAGNRLNIVILDACRNNPFAGNFRGAVPVGLAPIDAPDETFIAYSTAPGKVAADGSGRNSPYTKALVTAIKTPGLDITEVFKNTAIAVREETDYQQVPWVSYNITQRLYLSLPLNVFEPVGAVFNRFRSEPADLSKAMVDSLLKAHHFFCVKNKWTEGFSNPFGDGFENDFEAVSRDSIPLILDHASGLLWQHAGSPAEMTLQQAGDYIRELNAGRFAGYSGWRLPTLEEAMTLVEAQTAANNLHQFAQFDGRQQYLWTVDNNGENHRWCVDFLYGFCYLNSDTTTNYVRAVRSGAIDED